MFLIGANVVIRRIFEMLVANVALSAAATAMYLYGAVTNDQEYFWLLLAFILVFTGINFVFMRNCYFDLRHNKLYYTTNIVAYLLFIIISFVAYYFCPTEVFAWTFAIGRFLKYTENGIATTHSLVIFHLIGLISIKFAPIGLEWVMHETADEPGEEGYEAEDFDEML